MEDHGRLFPAFWTGRTGRILRSHRDAQVLGAYLVSCAHRRPSGIYRLPLETIHKELGITGARAKQAFKVMMDVDFAHYHEPTETVYVPGLALHTMGNQLTPEDNRWQALVRDLMDLRRTCFFADFVARYRTLYGLPEIEQIPGCAEPAPPLETATPAKERPATPPPKDATVMRQEAILEMQVIEALNEAAGTSWKAGKHYGGFLRARIDEGHTLDDFLAVIQHKSTRWAEDERMRDFLAPTTLFRPWNFERYLTEATNAQSRPRPAVGRDRLGRISSVDAARLLRQEAIRLRNRGGAGGDQQSLDLEPDDASG